MRLLNRADSAEKFLAAEVLRSIPGVGFVYGGGPVEAGDSFEELIRSHQAGELAGVAGLVITEELVSSYSPGVRQGLGLILQCGGVPFVADEQGMNWSLHLGFRARRGTWIGWAATEEQAEHVLQCFNPGPDSTDDVGVAIARAILDLPCWLLASHPLGSASNLELRPIVRWAHDAGVVGNVRSTLEYSPFPPARVSRELVAQRREQALAMIAALQSQSDPLSEALGISSSAPPVRAAGVKTLELGVAFDPAKWYSDEYFGGQAALQYCKPDGSWVLHTGLGGTWEGFAWIAHWLAKEVELGALLDLGCGTGDLVKHARARGFNAVGFDISEAAIRRADESVRPFLHVKDISCDGTKDPVRWGIGEQDIICAFDLWEHIFIDDIDGVMESVREHLRIGGIGFWNICTRGEGEEDWTIRRGDLTTKENSWLLVMGHVTIRSWEWWATRFADHGLMVHDALNQGFNVARASNPAMRMAESWSARNVMIVEKVR